VSIGSDVVEYLLSQIAEDIEYGRGDRKRLALLAKKGLDAELARIQSTPLRFQSFEHPAKPETCEIWIIGGRSVEVDVPSQISLGLHVLAWAASLPRCHVPLRVIDPTLTPAGVGRVRVAVSAARDFILVESDSADLATALDKSRIKLRDDGTASFWPKPCDPPLILNPP
jgi:hypothetical protein